MTHWNAQFENLTPGFELLLPAVACLPFSRYVQQQEGSFPLPVAGLLVPLWPQLFPFAHATRWEAQGLIKVGKLQAWHRFRTVCQKFNLVRQLDRRDFKSENSLTRHGTSTQVNLKSISLVINLNPTTGDSTIKTTMMPLIKTCITSLQHISGKLSFNTWQSFKPLTEVRSICHHKLFPCGRDKAKLCTTSYRAGYIENPGTTSKGTRLVRSMREWPPMDQTP